MDRRIEVAIVKIEADPGACDPMSLARLVSLSLSRFRHLFRKETGITPARYLKTARLRKAGLLLRTTFLTMKEITTQLGLTDTSHFGREFKNLFGMSPTQYRSAHKEMNGKRRNRKK